jgi:signal recognition particle subunit SRP54
MIKNMGSIGGLLKMIPGLSKQMRGAAIDERALDRVEAIILSMTPAERLRPDILNGTRRARIARGSGTSVQQINALLVQHKQMKKMTRSMVSGSVGIPGFPGMGSTGASKKRKKKR